MINNRILFRPPLSIINAFTRKRCIRVVALSLCISFATGCAVAPLQGLPLPQSPATSAQFNAEFASSDENLLLPYRGRRHGKWGRRGKHYPNFGFVRGVVAATVVMVLLHRRKDRSDY